MESRAQDRKEERKDENIIHVSSKRNAKFYVFLGK